MPAPYRIPAATHRTEEVIERSRFITSIGRAASAEEARAFIDGIRAQFGDATHHCWAYQAGPPGSTHAIGFSDAGEPHGTAGRPMLDVLLHSGIGEIVAVVTRYYGGTKLGKGGLVRAYGGCVQSTLASLQTEELVERDQIIITAAYGDVDALRRLLQAHGAEVLDEQYAAEVRYVAAVPADQVQALRLAVADATAGRARLDS